MNDVRKQQIRYMLTLSLMALAIWLFSPIGVFASETEEVEIVVEYHQEMARPIADMINEYRTSGDAWYWNEDNTTKTECGYLPALKYDYDLEKAAMQRAAEIAVIYAHTRPDGSRCFTAYSECGFNEWPAGENIAAGQTSAKIVHDAWIEENDDYSGQGHRRNIFNASSVAIGIGCAYSNGTYFWVEEFAYSSQNLNETVVSNEPCTVTVRLFSDGVNVNGLKCDEDDDHCYGVYENGPARDYFGSSYWTWVGDNRNYIALTAGESAQIPITGILFTYSSVETKWTKSAVMKAEPDFSVKDESVAKIENGKITAVGCGATELNVQIRGTSLSLPVVVGHEYKEMIRPATKDKTGLEYRECAHCGKIKDMIDIAKIGEIQIEKSAWDYTGKAVKPKISVMDDYDWDIARSDYTITYSNNKKVGTATATVTFKNHYSGEETITFTINPKPVRITSVKTEGGVTVRWKKTTKQCDGYEIEYANNPSFTLNEGIAKVEGAKRSSRKLLFSKRNGKRYVRIRSYKIVNGKKYYSAWSDTYSYDY